MTSPDIPSSSTSSPPVRKPSPARPAPPLSPPPSIAEHPLLSALYEAFSKRTSDPLRQVISADAQWITPFFDASSADKVLRTIDDFLSFAVDPTITIYELRPEDDEGTLSFCSTISFNYPLPWRPRVSASITSTVSVSSSSNTNESLLVTKVEDKWYTSPFTLVVQSLPRLTDIFWLYPAPHAETDRGQRQKLLSTSDYTIIYQAPRAEYRVISNIQFFEKDLVWAMPALPEISFEGNLRRLEKYSTVSPICLRVLDNELQKKKKSLAYQWAIPVAGTLVGSSDVLAQFPLAERAELINVRRRLMAVSRFRGLSREKEVKKRVERLLDSLERDGVISGRHDSICFGGCNVWVRVYDCKVGFNSIGAISMAMFGSSTGVPRVNEIAIDLTDFVSEAELKKR